MQIPQGSKVIFKGGSFVGALPSRCEISDGAALTATSSSSSVVFAEGYAMPSGSTLTITGGTLTITTATINGTVAYSGATVANITSLVVSGSITIGSNTTVGVLTLSNEATLSFLNGAFLSVTTSATIGAVTLDGYGYFATPHGTDRTNIIHATGASVRICDYGAGASNFNAVSLSPTQASLTWSQTNNNATVLIEKNVNGYWVVINAAATSPLTTSL